MTEAEKIIKEWYENSPWATEYWDVEEDLAGLTELVSLIAERTRKECSNAYANWVWYPEKRKPVKPEVIEGCEIIRNAKWEDKEAKKGGQDGI